ncbi:MAG: sigma-54-dependent Fis family transcriptional regulator [Betaproteobacteria bacterium]|nr:sigma-54-dependent Fis family transcriptional regulator [Betaproteobacteria bacterium]
MAHILVVDDEIGIRELLSEILADDGHVVQLAESATSARAARNRSRPDLVLLDIWMPDADGLTLLKEWASGGLLNMPVIMMSGHATIDTAVEATRIGAMDFLEKPIALQKLLATVKRALGQSEQRDNRPGGALHTLSIASLAAPRSAALTTLNKRLLQAAATSVGSVLLRGERGAMPEFYARAFHQAASPWVNATQALSDGASDVLPQAAGGILFIEDLAQLSANQRRHLAFLVPRAMRAKVRLMSFSSEGPQALTETLGYEPSLLGLLGELTLAIPPLRDQAEDIPAIAQAMLRQLVDSGFCGSRRFAPEALEALQSHPWPGNLEELAAAVRTLAATSLGEQIDAGDVAGVVRLDEARSPTVPAVMLDLPLREAREAFERIYFEHHLALEDGSISRVAERSGLERTHLYRKLKALGISTNRRDNDA